MNPDQPGGRGRQAGVLAPTELLLAALPGRGGRAPSISRRFRHGRRAIRPARRPGGGPIDVAGRPLPIGGAEEEYDPAMVGPLTTRSDWLKENPPGESRLDATLAGVAARTRVGEDFNHAVREFLDEFSLRAGERARTQAIAERPAPTGEARYDAYLGALAEHLAVACGLERPPWSVEAERFLDTFWFVSDVPGFRASAIAQAPAAFRRRGIFIPERSLHRV